MAITESIYHMSCTLNFYREAPLLQSAAPPFLRICRWTSILLLASFLLRSFPRWACTPCHWLDCSWHSCHKVQRLHHGAAGGVDCPKLMSLHLPCADNRGRPRWHRGDRRADGAEPNSHSRCRQARGVYLCPRFSAARPLACSSRRGSGYMPSTTPSMATQKKVRACRSVQQIYMRLVMLSHTAGEHVLWPVGKPNGQGRPAGSTVQPPPAGEAHVPDMWCVSSGTWADYVAVKEEFLAPAPGKLSLSEAAGAVPLVALTAFQVACPGLETAVHVCTTSTPPKAYCSRYHS